MLIITYIIVSYMVKKIIKRRYLHNIHIINSEKISIKYSTLLEKNHFYVFDLLTSSVKFIFKSFCSVSGISVLGSS